MNDAWIARVLGWVERGWVPDALVRWGARRLCAMRAKAIAGADVEAEQEAQQALWDRFAQEPIAVETRAANEQHYELPPEFFGLCLGPHRKYSSCYFKPGVVDLGQAEEEALRLTCEHADLVDGQDVLELGCGWGSLTLWMAQRYPRSRITAVSNSAPQRLYIEAEARRRGLSNARVITADINTLTPPGLYDRVVSVEMFEHMRNHRELMRRVSTWLRPQGSLFVHIFTHRTQTYLYEAQSEADFIARHFFTGGMMPGEDLLVRQQEHLRFRRQWRWSGTHYAKTANAWLARLDAQRDLAIPILESTYGKEQAPRWLQRWRLFFIACAELWGYDGGRPWCVSHYLFTKPDQAPETAPAPEEGQAAGSPAPACEPQETLACAAP